LDAYLAIGIVLIASGESSLPHAFAVFYGLRWS